MAMEGIIHIDFGGPERKIRVGCKTYWFEDHRYFGPCPMNGRTKELLDATAWGVKHPFWEAHRLWEKQGKRVDDAGFCVWEREKIPAQKLQWIGGRSYKVVTGEEECLATHEVRDGVIYELKSEESRDGTE